MVTFLIMFLPCPTAPVPTSAPRGTSQIDSLYSNPYIKVYFWGILYPDSPKTWTGGLPWGDSRLLLFYYFRWFANSLS